MAGNVNSSDDEDLLGYNPNQPFHVSSDESGEAGGSSAEEIDVEEVEEEDSDEEEESGDELDGAVGGPEGLPHPEEGMEFPDYSSMIDYLTEYSLLVGFGYRRKELTRKKVGEGPPDFLRLECCKKGEYSSVAENPEYAKRSKKCGCEVILNARQKKDSPWTITKAINDHNHECVKENTRHMSTHRKMTMAEDRELRLNALVGIPLCKSYALMARRKGGIKKMGFSEKDGRNRLNKIRRVELEGGDYQALRYYLDKILKECPNSFCASDMNEEGRLRNIFWADGRSREAAKDFGDVISFDATYMKNRYKMPFCPFIGVNHHGQSILLGCALIGGESTKNYKWVFEQWKICMGKSPAAVVTDQSAAIGAALKKVFHGVRHRLCLFHIQQNAKRHLKRKLKTRFAAFYSRMKSVMHLSLEVESFLEEWDNMLEEFGMRENKWLKKIYSIREKWAPVYFKGDFWAGMSSTQRSEGMNNYFKSFVNLDTTLKEFGVQFNEALAKRVEAEAVETFRMNDAPLVARFEYPMEAVFCALYTKVKVRAFQKECAGVSYCVVHVRGNKPDLQRYVIQDKCGRCKWASPLGMFYRVAYKPSTKQIGCQCKNFEFTGILCRHILSVFQAVGVDDVPLRYIVSRWRRDLPRNYLKFSIPGTSPEAMGPEPARYFRLREQFEDVASVVVVNPNLLFEMEAYMRDLSLRGMTALKNQEGVELLEGGPGVGGMYGVRRQSVCPHPIPLPSFMVDAAPADGLVAGLEPGLDPLPRRGPGRMPGHRRGYNQGNSSRGGARGGGRGSAGAQNGGNNQVPGNNNFLLGQPFHWP